MFRSMIISHPTVCLMTIVLLFSPARAAADASDPSAQKTEKKKDKEKAEKDESKYQSYNEAWSIGVAFYNSRNYAAATEPLEAALRMAPGKEEKLKVYKALIPCYRLDSGNKKMMKAVEYVMKNAALGFRASMTTRSYLSFLHQRGKTKEAIERYEDRLKKSPDDKVALRLLGEIYTSYSRNPDRAKEILRQLQVVAPIEMDGSQSAFLQQGSLARSFTNAKDYESSAKIYGLLAEKDADNAGQHLKDLADVLLRSGETKKAVEVARKAVEAGPDRRSEQLTYYWYRSLGDLLLEHGEASEAVPLLKKAVTLTKIEGYLKTTKEKLEEAKAKAKLTS